MKRWRLLPHPLLTVLLTLTWLLLNNSLSPGQLLLGLLLGWGIPLLCQDFLLHAPRLRRPLLLLRYMLMVLYDIIVANLHVARLVLGRTEALKPAFIEVPIDIEDEFLLTLLACVVSLTPGTVSSGLSGDRKTLLLHGLDVADKDEVIRQVKTRYEAPLKEIFECSPT
ncbi:multicomponent K+:H+ antiporter subunit E [Pseudomonas sp. SORGH_AS199]|jgi:multicomponent K+:H+ antiporter subunit E|uniref:Na+/H+ antiporter subunit E n=1 Tax=Pseudomonas TaxID=286 RepID=UPI0010609556|nr:MULTISPECIES: Na+/H+ antiporter subunit E [Pseudomonas]MDK8262801.1 Na+/H+ antiporter subunit E [Pseudomonas oryzihabitans]MDR6227910.1 multicomponent K+:H+ antiporter subunit E [Pseudomonas sp. SORGH_AS_0199]